jgi:hypothetical protein
MKRGIILSAFILAIIVLPVLPVTSHVKETRNVKIYKVSFGVAGNLYINIGPEFKVVLEGEKRYLDDVITEVSGGKLVIKKENWKFNMNEKIQCLYNNA